MANTGGYRIKQMIREGKITGPYLWVDGYNGTTKADVTGTIMHGYDFRNHWYITVPHTKDRTPKDNNIMIVQINLDKREAQCFDIRKLTPRETGRLMGVREPQLDAMQASGLRPSALYKLFGNSIVVDVLAAIYRQVWYNDPTEQRSQQLELFPQQPWQLQPPRKARLISLCSGYDSQAMAFDVLRRWAGERGLPAMDCELVAWAEFDPESKAPLDRQPAVVAHNACFPDAADRNLGDMTKIDWQEVIRKYNIKVYGKERETRLDAVGREEYAHRQQGTDGQDNLHRQCPKADQAGTSASGEGVSAERHQPDNRSEVGRQSNADDSCGVRDDKVLNVGAEIDLLTYSTPCTDVSQAGKRAGIKKDSGTRSAVLWYTEEAIRSLRPRLLLQENVAALVNQQNAADFRQWRDTVQRLGYHSSWVVLNARDIGIDPALGPVPQNRDRLFMLSWRDDLRLPDQFPWPQPQALTRTIADVLDDDVPDTFFLRPESVISFLTRNEQGDRCLYRVSDHLPTPDEVRQWVRETTKD